MSLKTFQLCIAFVIKMTRLNNLKNIAVALFIRMDDDILALLFIQCHLIYYHYLLTSK